MSFSARNFFYCAVIGTFCGYKSGLLLEEDVGRLAERSLFRCRLFVTLPGPHWVGLDTTWRLCANTSPFVGDSDFCSSRDCLSDKAAEEQI